VAQAAGGHISAHSHPPELAIYFSQIRAGHLWRGWFISILFPGPRGGPTPTNRLPWKVLGGGDPGFLHGGHRGGLGPGMLILPRGEKKKLPPNPKGTKPPLNPAGGNRWGGNVTSWPLLPTGSPPQSPQHFGVRCALGPGGGGTPTKPPGGTPTLGQTTPTNRSTEGEGVVTQGTKPPAFNPRWGDNPTIPSTAPLRPPKPWYELKLRGLEGGTTGGIFSAPSLDFRRGGWPWGKKKTAQGMSRKK